MDLKQIQKFLIYFRTISALTIQLKVINQIYKPLLFTILLGNALTLYGLITFPYIERYKTTLWALAVYFYSMFGLTGGVHRMWTHKSFKANLPLRLIFASGYYICHQTSIKKWVRIHRVHHQYTDTDADPHNSRRGFIFCHIGWFMLKKHPDVKEKLKLVDTNDLQADSVVNLGDKHYWIIVALLQLLCTAVPIYFWNEEWYYSILIQVTRWMLSVHSTFFVNSLAHLWGYKPYDKNIYAVENAFVAYLTCGEGWHNYHHTFPYDYRMSEFSGFVKYDLSALMIRFFEKIGWAYDLKTASDSTIRMTVSKRGDPNLVKPY